MRFHTHESYDALRREKNLRDDEIFDNVVWVTPFPKSDIVKKETARLRKVITPVVANNFELGFKKRVFKSLRRTNAVEPDDLGMAYNKYDHELNDTSLLGMLQHPLGIDPSEFDSIKDKVATCTSNTHRLLFDMLLYQQQIEYLFNLGIIPKTTAVILVGKKYTELFACMKVKITRVIILTVDPLRFEYIPYFNIVRRKIISNEGIETLENRMRAATLEHDLQEMIKYLKSATDKKKPEKKQVIPDFSTHRGCLEAMGIEIDGY